MSKFNEEISHWNEYNYVVINDQLEECYKKIMQIIDSEKRGEKFNQNINEIKNKITKLTN